MIVELEKKWVMGDRLTADGGGFGFVFEAKGEGGEDAVVKLVDKAPGAERELLFGAVEAMRDVPNVVPIWDSGEHGDKLALVMPRAETSLRQHLISAGGPLQLGEAVEILSDVATALVGIAKVAVHRDLKPENVLYLDGKWCLADFGIARYTDASTDPETRKASFTRQYAAPEQWKHEHATSAADIYAFGVMAYELLMGERPFAGPDFRDQHLHQLPPELSVGTPRLRVLVEECLLKAPGARPTAELVVAKLQSALTTPRTGGAARLAALNRSAVQEKAAQHAAIQSAASEADRRRTLAESASLSFASIEQQLRSVVEEDAPEAQVDTQRSDHEMAWVASLSSGKLGVARVRAFEQSPWDGPFDVVAMASVAVNQASGRYAGRSHGLWYCDALQAGQYAWFEVAFMASAFGHQPDAVPFALEPRSASIAFNGVMGTTQVAWGPRELDRADLDEFVDRWIGWFADAGNVSLSMPGTLPEHGQPRAWRQRT